MKQVLQDLKRRETLVVEVPTPAPQPGTALVRTAISLVSPGTERMVIEFARKSLLGKAKSRPDLVRQMLDKARREGLLTTLEAALNRLDQPMPLGYSSAGTIVALGEGLQGYRVGQRVACSGGGYAVHAEYAVVPKNLLALLPENVDFEQAAFSTLGSIALHGFRLSKAQLGDRLAIIGLGLLGLLAAGIARAGGCHVLGIDLDPHRIGMAQEMGAEAVSREQAVEAAQAFTRGRGFDAILICADTPSSDPVELAGEIARDRARIIAVGAVGLHLPRKVYYEKELFFVNSRSYGPGRYDPSYEESGQDYPIGYVRWTEGRNLEAFVELLSTGRMDVHPLITHHFPIDRALEAYNLITGKHAEPYLGVLLTYDPGTDQDHIKDKIPKLESRLPDVSDGIDVTGNSARHVSLRLLDRLTRAPASCKLGVLGAGNFATSVLLPALRGIPDLELTAIVSASGTSARYAANRYGFRYASGDENQIFSDPDVNTIAILTRHHLHARQVVQALAAGKHVFCEKPLAIFQEELEEIILALGKFESREVKSTESDVAAPDSHHPKQPTTISSLPLLMVGFNRRFAPLAQHLKDFIEESKEPLAIHYRINAGYLPPKHWLHDPKQGGGRIIGEACHFIDFLTFLTGEIPNTVAAYTLPDDGMYREDNVILTINFPGGSLGTIAYLANGDKALPKERVEVFSGGRVAVLDDFRSLETIHQGKRRKVRSPFRQDKGHHAEWKAFIEAITSDRPPPIPYEHLFGVTQTTFAAVQALRQGVKAEIISPPRGWPGSKEYLQPHQQVS